MAEFFVKRISETHSEDFVEIRNLTGGYFAEIRTYDLWVKETKIVLKPNRQKKIEVKEVE